MTANDKRLDKCRLCGQEKRLCKSHIVPEFCYKRGYEDGKALQINLKHDGSQVVRTIQKGLREYLLCETCEACINSYERRFKEYWYDSPGLPAKMDLGFEGIRMTGGDFQTMKLFHLSVLWRAGESAWCKAVQLGRYRKSIADMLVSGDPGSPDHYPVFGSVLIYDDGTVNHGIVTEPLKSRFGKSTAYCMCYAGCEWHFIVTDHPSGEEKKLARGVDANGDLWLPYRHWLESGTVKVAKRLMSRMRR